MHQHYRNQRQPRRQGIAAKGEAVGTSNGIRAHHGKEEADHTANQPLHDATLGHAHDAHHRQADEREDFYRTEVDGELGELRRAKNQYHA